jgi:ABC-type amino acid transport substrate-binding protein
LSRAVLAWLLAALALVAPAGAQEVVLTDTLKTIAARGTILLGVREGAVPFAFRNKAGQPVGFSVDLCQGIAADVATAISQPLLEDDAPAWQRGLRVVFVPVAADERLQMLVSGKIDLECGSTTDNAEREKTIAFSPIFFLAGTRLLAPVGSRIRSWRDLTSVAVSAGTTNAEAMKRLVFGSTPPVRVVETPGVPETISCSPGCWPRAATGGSSIWSATSCPSSRTRSGCVAMIRSSRPWCGRASGTWLLRGIWRPSTGSGSPSRCRTGRIWACR